MRVSLLAGCLGVTVFAVALEASIIPMFHLDALALQAFEKYVAQFERNVEEPYVQSGKMWIDDTSSCCARKGALADGKPVLEPRENTDIAGGSIHHYSGVMHIAGGSIANVREIMQDYPNYPKYFKPDVGKGSGAKEPDSTPNDEHFVSHLSLIQSTLWIAVSYDCAYDTHYRMVDPHHWMSVSTTSSIREWRDPKDPSKGYYPEGDDHGFLWRTNTYWFVRENNDGIDLELDSLSLSRPAPTGFGWWGAKRTHDAVEKMLKDMRAAVETLR
jgi:hypothetical protein